MKLPVSAVARVAVGVVFVTAALLSACDNKDVAAPTSTRSDPANAGTQVPDPSVDVTEDILCDGYIHPDVIVVGIEFIRAGCTEAGRIIGRYVENAPAQGELVIEGSTRCPWLELHERLWRQPSLHEGRPALLAEEQY